jgi:hypothetical protein
MAAAAMILDSMLDTRNSKLVARKDSAVTRPTSHTRIVCVRIMCVLIMCILNLNHGVDVRSQPRRR